MTLEEAIEHAEERASEGMCGDGCRHDHAQLAEWLRELRDMRRLWGNLMVAYNGVCKRYNEADNRYIDAVNYLYGRIARLDCYNRALCQLVRDMHTCIRHIEGTDVRWDCTACPLDGTRECEFEERMESLGIKVDR